MLSDHRTRSNVCGRRRQPLRAFADQHDIGAAKSADAGDVEAWLDGVELARLEGAAVERHVLGKVVLHHADPVAAAIALSKSLGSACCPGSWPV